MEQRVNIKFYFRLGKTATKAHKMLKQIYEEEALTRTRSFEWLSHFRDSRECLEDEVNAGYPCQIEKVREHMSDSD